MLNRKILRTFFFFLNVLCLLSIFELVVFLKKRQIITQVENRVADLENTHSNKLKGDISSFHATHILKQTVFAIKSYDRPKCLERLLQSISTQYPYLDILIVDDSDKDSPKKWVPTLKWVHMHTKNSTARRDVIHLDKVIGAAGGRNMLVDEASKRGYKFLVMSDDDYEINQPKLIKNLAHVLAEEEADLVAAVRDDMQVPYGSVVLESHELLILPNVTRQIHKQSFLMKQFDCHHSDLFQQFFIAKIKALEKIKWDPELTMNDHYDFMINARYHGMKTVSCAGLVINHNTKACLYNNWKTADAYIKTRNEEWSKQLPNFFKKHKVDIMYDESGNMYHWNSQNNQIESKVYSEEKFPIVKEPKVDMEVKLFYGLEAETGAYFKKIQPCVDLENWLEK